MTAIDVFSVATLDQACHGLNLQVVVRRQGQGRASLGRQWQWTSPALLNVGPESAAQAASRTGLPMRESTKNEDGARSRCCFSAWCRGMLDLSGVTLLDKAQQLGSSHPRSWRCRLPTADPRRTASSGSAWGCCISGLTQQVLHMCRLPCNAQHSCSCLPGSGQSRAACCSARNCCVTSPALETAGLARRHSALQHCVQLWTCCASPTAGPGNAGKHVAVQGTAAKHGATELVLLQGMLP